MLDRTHKAQHCPTFYKIEQQSLENNRRLLAGEKWHRMGLLNALAEKRLRADIFNRHPHISEHEMKMRVI